MGGAFIAVADDATAASWNPAGLIQIERPEVSMVVSGSRRAEENLFSENSEANGVETISNASINYFSVSTPVQLWGYSLTLSLNYQRLYDFARAWDFPMTIEGTEGLNEIHQEQQVSYSQDGGLSALGLACGILITPDFSIGFALNIWDDDLTENHWEKSIVETGQGNFGRYTADFESVRHRRYSFKGLNANLGFLWSVSRKLTLGAVLKTPFRADLNHREWSYTKLNYTQPNFPADFEDEASSEEECTLHMPMSYGMGLAYRASDALTVSMDLYRTRWDDYKVENSQGRTTCPLTGKPYDESDIAPTLQVRTGAEYLLIKPRYLIPLRCGFFYDPAPAEGKPDDFFGATLGTGVTFKRFSLDVAYQYRFADDVGESILQEYGFSQDVREHTLYASVICYF
ncbi:outer membrane protein transport protein [Desulfoluna sp.]|uniref:OmpP1/FadL family transporter n=1 Tax=Desulfoluna sp. TaxID=2045199 RepID=UPI002622BF05|nr:outer membrane protein transport protein [Desulfoluna sp.]